MLSRPQSIPQLRQTFEQVLKAITSGDLGGCPTDTGLDEQTVRILNSLAAQPGKKKAVDIVACRTEFMWMLDGTHAREDDAEWRRLLGSGESTDRNPVS